MGVAQWFVEWLVGVAQWFVGSAVVAVELLPRCHGRFRGSRSGSSVAQWFVGVVQCFVEMLKLDRGRCGSVEVDKGREGRGGCHGGWP